VVEPCHTCRVSSPSELVSSALLDAVSVWRPDQLGETSDASVRAAESIQHADAVVFTITENEDGVDVDWNCAPLVSGALLPMHYLARELARASGRTIEEVVHDARAWIDHPTR